MGDLGNILADQEGVAIIDMEDPQLSLTGMHNILGRGVVIHAGMDDMGKVSTSVVVMLMVMVVVIMMIMLMAAFAIMVMFVNLRLNPALLILKLKCFK